MTLLAGAMTVGLAAPSHAQLVNMHNQYKVAQVDMGHNRLVVEGVDQTSNTPQWFVDCNGLTQVTYNGHLIPWTSVHPGDVIEVNGGLTWNGHIKGKSIQDLGIRAGE